MNQEMTIHGELVCYRDLGKLARFPTQRDLKF
jgi:hypothetical protein